MAIYSVSLIDTIQPPAVMHVLQDQNLHHLLILRDAGQVDLTVHCVGPGANANIRVLCIGTTGCTIRNTTLVTLDASHTTANVTMLSLLKDGSDVTIHGNVTLNPDVSKVSGHLLEENIILGEKIKIRTAPILDVRSSDVSASHGCRVERLDPKRLFYMQSRGLTQSESQSLILDGYLNAMLEGFELDDIIIQDIKRSCIS